MEWHMIRSANFGLRRSEGLFELERGRNVCVYGERSLLNFLVHVSLVHLKAFLSRFSCSSLPKVWSRPGFPVRLGQENRSRRRFHCTSGTCTKRPPRVPSMNLAPRTSPLYASAACEDNAIRTRFPVRSSSKTLLPPLFQGEACRKPFSESDFLAHCTSVQRWIVSSDSDK